MRREEGQSVKWGEWGGRVQRVEGRKDVEGKGLGEECGGKGRREERKRGGEMSEDRDMNATLPKPPLPHTHPTFTLKPPLLPS